MNKLEMFQWNRENLYNACLLASVAHAIMVAHYPDLSNEHSWDGKNYNIQDNMGIRGTITFERTYCTAAFRDENSERIMKKNILANEYFKEAPKDIRQTAELETLQYLLDDVDGNDIPIISTGFWGGNTIFSIDTKQEFIENGGGIIKIQLKSIDEGIEAWEEYYDMSPNQCTLLKDIYNKIITCGLGKTVMNKNDIDRIECNDIEDLKESEIAFQEIGIEWKYDTL